jgi:hypothetical protein
MKIVCVLRRGFTVLALLLASSLASAQTIPVANTIASLTADVGGVKLHYLKAGDGPAVVLPHGCTQTSRMWRPIIPLLAKKFLVIAPDLPSIGDSDIPKDGLDMKSVETHIEAITHAMKQFFEGVKL